jgi:hypothetical protein
MNWEQIDWDALDRLRTAFLEGSAGRRDYWQSDSDLASYDQTFAQRIGWKWDYVLGELARRGWTPPSGPLLDWGCGSGVAHRAFLDHFGTGPAAPLQLWDRSSRARAFAQRRALEKYPGLTIRASPEPDGPIATLLLSHVLTELDDAQTRELLVQVQQATAVLWVEPGTFEVSRRLIELRETVRAQFHLVAPCTHREACGLLSPENASHWCHHFASPPSEVFQDRNWARFSALAGIDLRSLPLSFLVLDQRPVRPFPPGAVRILGRPRLYKSHALLLGSGSAGVYERRLSKRAWPEAFRRIRKGSLDPWQVWECEGEDIVGLRDAL